jgi:hypothetical protein
LKEAINQANKTELIELEWINFLITLFFKIFH